VDDLTLNALTKNGICSYAFYGTQHNRLKIYHCFDCEEELGGESSCVCEACANICHKGHKLGEGHVSWNAFCDCGPEGEKMCSCLMKPHEASLKAIEAFAISVAKNPSEEFLREYATNLLHKLKGHEVFLTIHLTENRKSY
jgi:hypothetical protein